MTCTEGGWATGTSWGRGRQKGDMSPRFPPFAGHGPVPKCLSTSSRFCLHLLFIHQTSTLLVKSNTFLSLDMYRRGGGPMGRAGAGAGKSGIRPNVFPRSPAPAPTRSSSPPPLDSAPTLFFIPQVPLFYTSSHHPVRRVPLAKLIYGQVGQRIF